MTKTTEPKEPPRLPWADEGQKRAVASSRRCKIHSLIDKVYKPLNLYITWEKVKANRGKGGAEGHSLNDFEEKLHENIHQLYLEL